MKLLNLQIVEIHLSRVAMWNNFLQNSNQIHTYYRPSATELLWWLHN